MKVLQITHTDLDGAAAGVVAKLFFPYVETLFLDYKDIDGIMLNKNYGEYDTIIISDISFKNPEIIKKLSGKDVYIADHHSTGLWLTDYFEKSIIHEGGDCGAVLLYRLLKKYFPDRPYGTYDEERLQEYLKYVNAWDTWTWVNDYDWNTTSVYEAPPFLHSQMLRVLRYQYTYVEDIMPYFYGWSDEIYSKENYQRLKSLNEKQEQSIQTSILASTIKEVDTKTYGKLKYREVINDDGIVSILAWEVDKQFKGEGYDFVLIHSSKGTTGSTRYPREGIDLAKLCEEWGGGGHPRAAGFNYKQNKYRFE